MPADTHEVAECACTVPGARRLVGHRDRVARPPGAAAPASKAAAPSKARAVITLLLAGVVRRKLDALRTARAAPLAARDQPANESSTNQTPSPPASTTPALASSGN